MVKINILCIGKIKDNYIREGISEFSKRLSKYVNFNIIELQEENENRGITSAIAEETERIISILKKRNRSYNILLDIKGIFRTSEEMANEIEQIFLSFSEINFIIGGSNGVGNELKKTVHSELSFSSFTFPHQLMRLILTEQIYRWISINKNIKYHK